MINGYKATSIDMKCKGNQYQLGVYHVHNGDLVLGKSGLHFSMRLVDTFRYYPFNGKNRYFHCIADECIHGLCKSTARNLMLTREILPPELYHIAIEHDPNNIQYIFPQTEELCIKAIKLDNGALKHVRNKTDAILAAVE